MTSWLRLCNRQIKMIIYVIFLCLFSSVFFAGIVVSMTSEGKPFNLYVFPLVCLFISMIVFVIAVIDLGIWTMRKNTELEDIANRPKPRKEDYGWQSADHYEIEGGWMVEGGEEQYWNDLKQWEKGKKK